MTLLRSFVRTGLNGLVADARALVRALVRAVVRAPSLVTCSRWSRALLGGLLTFWMLAVASGSAHAVLRAEDAVAPGAATREPWDSLTTAQDSHGLTLADYALSLNTGGLREPITAASAFMIDVGWGLYRLVVGISLWMLEVVTEFTWLDLLRVPADAFANVVGAVIGDLGLVPALATISVLVSGLLLLRGRTGAAFGEICTTLVVASLFTTALVNPVGTVAGENGLLATSKDLGLAISQQLMGEETGGEVTMPTGRVMEAMVRLPHQYVNYGTHIDASGAGCVEAYDTVLLDGGKYGDLGGSCPDSAVEAAENPASSYPVALLVGPGAVLLLGFVLALTVALFLLTALVIWQAAKFVWEMLKALLPGTSRAGLFTAMTTVVIGCALVVGGLVAVAVFVMVLDQVYTATTDWNPIHVFAFVDIMLLVTIVAVLALLMHGRKEGRKLGEKLAESLSPRPTSMPASRGLGVARMASSAAGAYASHRALARRRAAGGGPGAVTAPGAGGGEGTGAGPAPSSSRKPSGFVAGARTAARGTAKGAALATKVALGSTVLAPVAVPRAAAAASGVLKARKAAMATKLAAAGEKASTAVKAKRQQVVDYGKEYGHNVAAAGRLAGRAARPLGQAAGQAARGGAQAGRWAAKSTGADRAAVNLTMAAAARMGPGEQARRGDGTTSTGVHAPAAPGRPPAQPRTASPARSHGTSPADIPRTQVQAPQAQAASQRRTNRLRALLSPVTARRRRRAA